jgi:hypothetical protein
MPVLVPVDEAGHHGVGVGARADEEQDDEQERLEVEDCGLTVLLACEADTVGVWFCVGSTIF